MKILLQGLAFLMLFTSNVSAAELSTFIWDQNVQGEGLQITGPLTWNPTACDFQTVNQLHDFPIFSYKGPSGKPRKDATGAYCFQIQVPPEMLGRMLHISMIRIFGNAELLINQNLVWQQNSSTGPKRLSVLHDVESQVLQVELRLRCNEAPNCGWRGNLHVRDQRQGTRSDLMHYSYDLLAVAGILACFFYHLIFALLRRRSSTALFLSFNALALILRLVLSGQGQLHYFLQLSESWYWRLETLAVLIVLPSSISLVRSVFEEETPQLLPTLGWVIGLTASAFLLLDARIFPFLLLWVYVLVFLNFYQAAIVAIRALRHKRSGSMIFVVSSLITFVSTTFEVLNARLNFEMHTAVQPISYLMAMIFQSVLLATRINDAFVLAEQQESEIKNLREKIEIEIRSLDQKILERTTELRTIFQSISTGILWISCNEQGELEISSEYSDYLRETIGFDIQSWHEMHFFLRRLRLPDLPRSGKELAQWFQQQIMHKDALDQALENRLGGLKVFDDLDRVKHLKFKWVPIVEENRVTELFIFVFDVSLSIELEALALYKGMEIEALRELAALPPALIEELHQVLVKPSLPVLRRFASDHQLQHLEQALFHPQSEAHPDKFMQAYRRVVVLLADRQSQAHQQKHFDLDHFLHLPDWQNLHLDSRSLIHELVRLRVK